MPSFYAHYRFGAAMLQAMPADLRRPVNRFRQLFDMGLHGPDIFSYCTPLPGGKTVGLSYRFHRQTGAEFFGRVCRSLRLEPSEGGTAYLYGLLCHYCLDAACQAFVQEQAQTQALPYREIETEFDRFLLEKDGKIPARTQNLGSHIQLTAQESETVARFYPGVHSAQVRDGVRNMALFIRLMTGSNRALLQSTLRLTPGQIRAMIMTDSPNPRCAQLDEALLSLYDQAAERFPGLLLQLNAHLTYNAPLGEAFAAQFRG